MSSSRTTRPDQDPPASAVAQAIEPAREPAREFAEDVPPGWSDAPRGWRDDWDSERERRPLTTALGGPSFMIVYVDEAAEMHKRVSAIGKLAVPITRAEARRLYCELRQTLYSGDEEVQELYERVHARVVADIDAVLAPLRASASPVRSPSPR